MPGLNRNVEGTAAPPAGDVMARWEEILTPYMLGGVELPTATRTLSGGRDMMRGRPVNRPGQTTQDLGRRPYRFTLRVPMFSDMDEVNYPDDYQDLLFLLNDDESGGAYEYIDGVLGAYNVRVSDWSVTDEARSRDGGEFSITLEENSQDPAALRFSLDNGQALTAGSADVVAQDIDQELEAAGVTDAELNEAFEAQGVPLTGDEKFWPEGSTFTNATQAAFVAVSSATLTAAQASAKVERFAGRVNALLELPQVAAAGFWNLRASAVRLGDSLRAALVRRQQQNPTIVEVTTLAATDVYTLASKYSTTPDELIKLNSFARPTFIKAQTIVKVPAP